MYILLPYIVHMKLVVLMIMKKLISRMQCNFLLPVSSTS